MSFDKDGDVASVYQCERWVPLKGFSVKNLMPHENEYVVKSLECARKPNDIKNPPKGFQWVEGDEGEWKVGEWMFAFDFVQTFYEKMGKTHCVRRRKWSRKFEVDKSDTRSNRSVSSTYSSNSQTQTQMYANSEDDVIAAHNDEVAERDEIVGKIVDTMQDVNEMTRDLSAMIHDQGSILDNIEHNVDVANDQVQAGVDELVIAEKYQKSGSIFKRKK
eukprot:m.11476 g.11476  ORF g.11476 m.11476 type:complete len:218 (+) comp8821_c0_seq1:267-920(+)